VTPVSITPLPPPPTPVTELHTNPSFCEERDTQIWSHIPKLSYYEKTWAKQVKCVSLIVWQWHSGNRRSLDVTGRGKAFPIHATKTYRGNESIALLILYLGTWWRWVVNFTPQPLFPGKESWGGGGGRHYTSYSIRPVSNTYACPLFKFLLRDRLCPFFCLSILSILWQ
jgi:hypothetical protein